MLWKLALFQETKVFSWIWAYVFKTHWIWVHLLFSQYLNLSYYHIALLSFYTRTFEMISIFLAIQFLSFLNFQSNWLFQDVFYWLYIQGRLTINQTSVNHKNIQANTQWCPWYFSTRLCHEGHLKELINISWFNNSILIHPVSISILNPLRLAKQYL